MPGDKKAMIMDTKVLPEKTFIAERGIEAQLFRGQCERVNNATLNVCWKNK